MSEFLKGYLIGWGMTLILVNAVWIMVLSK